MTKSLLETERRLGLESFDFFNEYILDCRNLAPVHHELCLRAQYGPKKQLTLIPRGHLKSTIDTVGYSVWRIIKDPNIRILIMNAKTENAENFLSEIKGHLESNQLLRRYYGDFVGKKWNEGEIIVSKRTKVLKDPTVYCAGVGASVVSRHVDLVIPDDVVNETNTTTRDQIEKVKDWWRLTQSCGDGEQTEWRIVGTRYHFDDLYGDIILNFPDMYDIYIRTVYEDNKLIYPQKFTERLIEEIKREQGSYIYSCQYLNNPVDDDEAIFKRSWLRVYKENEINHIGQHNIFITLDPAVSEESTADFSVFTVNFVDRFNNWWIKEFRSGRFRTKELIDLIFELDETYKPLTFGVESNAFQKIIHYQLEEEMKRRNYFIPITELKPDLRTKKTRIRGLQPRFEYGTILIPEDTKETDLFLNEYLRFPKTTHDDRLDSLAYQLDIAYPPRPKEGRKFKPKILSKLTGY